MVILASSWRVGVCRVLLGGGEKEKNVGDVLGLG